MRTVLSDNNVAYLVIVFSMKAQKRPDAKIASHGNSRPNLTCKKAKNSPLSDSTCNLHGSTTRKSMYRGFRDVNFVLLCFLAHDHCTDLMQLRSERSCFLKNIDL
ncbi:hypothetical protein TNCV_2403851 [Trichonephila clavipes]|nr:hypothetical protein TNCV_2403851 [Trichonephila clavipes]